MSPWPLLVEALVVGRWWKVRVADDGLVEQVGEVGDGSCRAASDPAVLERELALRWERARGAREDLLAYGPAGRAARRPPPMKVCRDAAVEPAESTCGVGRACRTTCATPSSVRATCVTIVENPWPHSTPAVWTSATGPAGPLESVTRAWWKSSKPSLYAMFL